MSPAARSAPAPTGAGRARRRRAAVHGDTGSITVLSIGCGLLALALILVVVSASAVHIERKRLGSLADAMAADAATAISLPDYYAGLVEPGSGAVVPITDATVRATAQHHLRRAPASVTGRLEGVHVVEPTGTPDGATAQVSLAARARPPLVPWVLLPWADGIEIRASATARARTPAP